MLPIRTRDRAWPGGASAADPASVGRYRSGKAQMMTARRRMAEALGGQATSVGTARTERRGPLDAEDFQRARVVAHSIPLEAGQQLLEFCGAELCVRPDELSRGILHSGILHSGILHPSRSETSPLAGPPPPALRPSALRLAQPSAPSTPRSEPPSRCCRERDGLALPGLPMAPAPRCTTWVWRSSTGCRGLWHAADARQRLHHRRGEGGPLRDGDTTTRRGNSETYRKRCRPRNRVGRRSRRRLKMSRRRERRTPSTVREPDDLAL